MEMMQPVATFSPHPLLPAKDRQLIHAVFIPGETIEAYLTRTGLMRRIRNRPVSVAIDGMRVPRGMWRNIRPKHGTMININALVHGGGGGGGKNPLATIATIALMVYAPQIGFAMLGEGAATAAAVSAFASTTLGAFAVAGVMLVGGMAINAIFPPPRPSLGTGNGFVGPGQESPTYSLSGGSNSGRPYQPMPVIMGAHRVFPDLGARTYTEFEGEDQYLYQVFDFGYNDLTLSDFKIGTTPIADFSGVETEISGASGALNMFPANVDSLAGGALTYAASWITRTSSADATGLAVEISGSQYGVNDNGTLYEISRTIEIEYRAVGSGTWLPFWAGASAVSIAHGKRAPIRSTYKINVASGQYEVRVRRVNADETDPKLFSELGWNQLRTYQPDAADYTGRCRVALKIKASGQISGSVQQFSALASAKTLMWNGSAWVTAATSNPAWWVLAAARGKFVASRRVWGCGLSDSRIDLEGIKAFATWCTSKSLTFNAVFDQQISAYDMMNSIAMRGRGTISRHSGRVEVVWDAPNLPAVAVFGMSNIKVSSFEIVYVTEQLADEVVASYINPDSDWQRDVVRALAPGVTNPVRSVSMDLFGCTNTTEAGKTVNLYIANNIHRTTKYKWQMDWEGMPITRGEVGYLSHDLASYDYSGRLIEGSTASVLKLERIVPQSGGTAYVTLVKPDGSFATYPVTAAISESDQLTLTTPLSFDPGADPDHTVYDYRWLYGFTATPGKKVKIDSFVVKDYSTVEITAIDETSDYYDSETNPYTHVPAFVSFGNDLVLSGLTVTEELVKNGNGFSVKLIVSWATSGQYASANVRIAENGGSMRGVGTTYDNSIEFIVGDSGTVDIDVTGMHPMFGPRAASALSTTHTIIGKAAAPENVTGLAYAHGATGTAVTWDENPDVDLDHYEIRKSAYDWASGVVVYAGSDNRYLSPYLPAGATSFWVKAIDTSGNEGATATRLDVTVTLPAAPSPSAAFLGQDYALTWPVIAGSYPTKVYRVRRGGSYVGGTQLADQDVNSYIAKIDWSGSTTFWVAAVMENGEEGTPGSTSLNATVPGTPSVLATPVGEEFVISWSSPTSVLPLEEYVVRYGSTFESGNPVGVVKGNQLAVKADWTGARTFWVAAKNTAGTVGSGGSAVATVTLYGAPTVSGSIVAVKAQIGWSTPTGGSLPIAKFEIRHGASWAAGAFVADSQSSSFRVPIDWTGARTFWVAAKDVVGNYGTAGSAVVTVSVPSAPTLSGSLVSGEYVLSWVPGSSSLPIAEYELRNGASWAGGTVLGRVKGTSFNGAAQWSGTRTFWIAAYDENNNVGAAGSTSIVITAPSAPSIAPQAVDNNVLLKWSDSVQTLPIKHYVVKKGASWAAGELIGTVGGRFSAIFETSAGTYTYWIAGVDVAGNEGTPSSAAVLVNQPPDYILYDNMISQMDSTTVSNVLRVNPNQYALNLDGSTQYGSVASIPDLDSGLTGLTMECWAAIDQSLATQGLMEKTIAGNVNTCALLFYGSGNVYARVMVGATMYTATSALSGGIDKTFIHATLRWSSANGVQLAINGVNTATLAAAGTLDQAAGALKVGQLGTGATAYSLKGKLGPCRVYKRRITDTEILEHYRGIYKDNTSLVATWNMTEGSGVTVFDDSDNANDLALYAAPTWSRTVLDGRIDETETAAIYYPVNPTKKFSEHFSDAGQTTHAGMIAAGSTHGLAPSPTTGSYAEVVDYGTTIASSKISIALNSFAVVGAVTITPTISYKLNWGDSWTDTAGVYSLYASNFRYVKITLAFSCAGGSHIGKSLTFDLTLDVKVYNDSGSVTCASGDSGGTTVSFNVAFVDVRSIQVTPKGTAAVIATYDFVDAPNPTTFKVLLFDRSTGARVSGDASWAVSGA